MFLPHIPSGSRKPQGPLTGIFWTISFPWRKAMSQSCDPYLVHDGSLVEGCWNCAQLKRGKPLKASSLVEEQSPSFNIVNCWSFLTMTSDFLLGTQGYSFVFPTTIASRWAPFQGFLCLTSGLSLNNADLVLLDWFFNYYYPLTNSNEAKHITQCRISEEQSTGPGGNNFQCNLNCNPT